MRSAERVSCVPGWPRHAGRVAVSDDRNAPRSSGCCRSQSPRGCLAFRHGCGSFGVRLLSQEGSRVRAGGFPHLGELTGLYDDNPPSCDNAPPGTRKPSTIRTRTLPDTATLLPEHENPPGHGTTQLAHPERATPFRHRRACQRNFSARWQTRNRSKGITRRGSQRGLMRAGSNPAGCKPTQVRILPSPPLHGVTFRHLRSSRQSSLRLQPPRDGQRDADQSTQALAAESPGARLLRVKGCACRRVCRVLGGGFPGLGGSTGPGQSSLTRKCSSTHPETLHDHDDNPPEPDNPPSRITPWVTTRSAAVPFS